MKLHDPRDVVTPDAFSVARELLGIRLASPWRRLAAIGVDALFVAILAQTSLAVLIALVGALLLWRALAPAASRSISARAGRVALRLTMALLAFVLVLKVWSAIRPERNDSDVAGPPSVDVDFAPPDPIGDIALPRIPGLDTLAEESDATTADTTGTASAGATTATSVTGSDDAGDTTAGAAEAPSPEEAIALQAENEQLRRRNRELEERVVEAEDDTGPVRAFFSEIANELGVGLGWFGFYFTALTVLGRGQTPGKRLLGIRVIRLDGAPIGWWIAFERFGGYAASFFSGTLGFAQILWDRNRQALHDKATNTVVIRVVRGEPVRTVLSTSGLTSTDRTS